ncbi:MAG: DUF3368 domain-containing protein [Terriglobia bacterium]
MTVVADSSPLVILAKLGCFDLLKRLFPRLYISMEVHYEVVVSGAGLPGASEVAKAEWIEVKQLKNQADLLVAQEKYALGVGELSTVLLGKEMQAAALLLDDYNARKLARAEGFQVRGSVGLLETFYLAGRLTDLRAAFRQLLAHSYIDQRLLDLRLRALGLPPL